MFCIHASGMALGMVMSVCHFGITSQELEGGALEYNLIEAFKMPRE